MTKGKFEFLDYEALLTMTANGAVKEIAKAMIRGVGGFKTQKGKFGFAMTRDSAKACGEELAAELSRGGSAISADDVLLHLAARGGVETPKTAFSRLVFLAAGGSPNARDSSETPLLILAVWHGQNEAVKAFLEAGADSSAKDASGLTALHAAVVENALHTIQVLIDSGADLEAIDDNGETPLAMATRRARGLAAEALLKCGADPNARLGERSLAFAAIAGNSVFLAKSLLLAGGRLDDGEKKRIAKMLSHSKRGSYEADALEFAEAWLLRESLERMRTRGKIKKNAI